jgi:hypothetical protein
MARRAEQIPDKELILLLAKDILTVGQLAIGALLFQNPLMFYQFSYERRLNISLLTRYQTFINTHTAVLSQSISFALLLCAFFVALAAWIRNEYRSPARLREKKEKLNREILSLQSKA